MKIKDRPSTLVSRDLRRIGSPNTGTIFDVCFRDFQSKADIKFHTLGFLGFAPV